jgi:hypothetical protein
MDPAVMSSKSITAAAAILAVPKTNKSAHKNPSILFILLAPYVYSFDRK